jgi:methyl-accepting chemotaxis protein
MSTTNIPNIPRLSFEEVWAITQESARLIQEIMQENAKQAQENAKRVQENAKQAQESTKQMQESTKQMQENTKQMQENAKQMQENAKQMQENVKQMQENAKQTQEKQQETETTIEELRRLQKQTFEEIKQSQKLTSEQIKQTGEQLGHLGNRFGDVEEYLVAPGIAEKFNELNYHFSEAARNIKIYGEDKQKLAEIDIMLENDNFILCVEVKVSPDEKDLRKHINRLKIVQRYFKNRRPIEKKIIGAIAGTVFDDEFKNTVIENGLYAIMPTGNTFKIDVPEGFQPKVFSDD